MRKLALAIVLVLVLVGGAVGGLAVATSANGGPTLKANGSSAPGTVFVSGSYWTPGVPVSLFMDKTDEAHYVAVATPNSVGRFVTSFVVGPTILGGHTIIGIQGATEIHAPFTLTSTSQVDDRTVNTLNGIGTVVDKTEGEVSDIHNVVAHVTIFDSESEYHEYTSDGSVVFHFGQTCHVSLTTATDLDGNDSVDVSVQLGDPNAYWLLGRIVAPSNQEAHTFQFDAMVWKISWHVDLLATTPTITLGWNITTTGEPNLIP